MEPAWDSLSLSLPLPHAGALSLSLSKQINLKKKFKEVIFHQCCLITMQDTGPNVKAKDHHELHLAEPKELEKMTLIQVLLFLIQTYLPPFPL